MNKKETMEENIIDTIKENEDRYRIHVNYQFEIEVDEGEYYAVRRKPQYPNTYEKCCEIIGYEPDRQTVTGYDAELIENFQKLIIYRNAYWKIAGEEMGLGKPWEPDFTDMKEMYYIFYKGYIEKGNQRHPDNHILIFPTPEMRDVFYENFKKLIEQCKEFL